MITYAQFTTDFAEFSNAAAYPQSSFNFYLNFASLMLTPRWGQPAPAGQPNTLYDIGTELFVAHNLALEAMNQKAAAAGGVPGLSTGPVSSKGAGAVSVSYDTTAGIVADAGHWNLTTYGIRFISMLLLLGAAPIQIGPHGDPNPLNGPAWPGLPTIPGWFIS
jgi:Protein of unknown function (DUF4054)